MAGMDAGADIYYFILSSAMCQTITEQAKEGGLLHGKYCDKRVHMCGAHLYLFIQRNT